MPEVSVVIAAGGRGTRMGGRTPKQFLPLLGVPVLLRSVTAFHALREVREIVLVVPAGSVRRATSLVRRGGFGKVTAVVEGGGKRQESVLRGLEHCTIRKGIVLVHDAVRPLVDRSVIRAVIRGAERYGAAVPGIPLKDTVKVEMDGRRLFCDRTLRRGELWAVQTPQGFRFPLLHDAHLRARSSGFTGTDDASLLERLGRPIRIVPGSEKNIKITTPDDRKLAEYLLGRG